MMLMGLATVGVGLLPTFDQIGGWAPVLLVLLRLVQGISVAGEWGGAALMAVEHAPPARRGRYGSSCQVGIPAGIILAQLMFFAVSRALSDEDFRSWGWRLPFLLSIVLIGVGLFVRLRIEQSPVFRELLSRGGRSAKPVTEVLRERPGRCSWPPGSSSATSRSATCSWPTSSPTEPPCWGWVVT